MTIYHYFIHYSVPSTKGEGNMVHRTNNRVMTIEQINAIQDGLREKYRYPEHTIILIDNITLLGETVV